MVAQTVQQSREEYIAQRRAQYPPDNLTVEQKVKLARKLALLITVEGNGMDARDKFKSEMIDNYGWEDGEVNKFMFQQSSRIWKTADLLWNWAREVGEIR